MLLYVHRNCRWLLNSECIIMKIMYPFIRVVSPLEHLAQYNMKRKTRIHAQCRISLPPPPTPNPPTPPIPLPPPEKKEGGGEREGDRDGQTDRQTDGDGEREKWREGPCSLHLTSWKRLGLSPFKGFFLFFFFVFPFLLALLYLTSSSRRKFSVMTG